MRNSDESISICSDEQSLELDCRRIIPKFRSQEYDTSQQDTNTSVFKRIMEIRSNSSEYRFKKQYDSNIYQLNANVMRKLSDDQYNQQQMFKTQKMKVSTHKKLNQNDSNNSTKKKRDKQLEMMNSLQLSPSKKKQQKRLSEKHSSKQEQSSPKSQSPKKPCRKISNQNEKLLEDNSQIKCVHFISKPNYVTQMINEFQDPLIQKLSYTQINRFEQTLNDNINPYGNLPRNMLSSITQPKGILKSKSCSNDGSYGDNSSRYKSSLKSSVFKKVTFETTMKGSKQMKQSSKNQLIMIQ